MGRKRVGILVFPEVEVLDFCGPFEVFSVTRVDESRRREEPSPFEALVIAETGEPVVATGGLRVLPDHDLASCPALDILVVPGGWGTRSLVRNDRVIGWIRERAGEAGLVASVCTGSFLLGQAGRVDGRRATTHWKSLGLIRYTCPSISVVRDEHLVVDCAIIASAGISAGIDIALRVVAREHGEAIARATSRHMEYPYLEHNDLRI